ncbi:MAG: hypothetical protein IH904_02985 [Proteobacteria bacterium]|nr:hypothetical protein [Pseudomonadota bacterium]
MYAATNYYFNDVEIVLFAPSPAIRRTLREALNNIGFRAIQEFIDVDQTRDAIVTYGPDLLIFDLDHDKEGICSIIADIRHGSIGSNPFLVIMLLTWDPEVNAVKVAMQTGVDDIVSMPISVRLLKQRIDNLINNRKRFVATEDYVGPERRAYSSSEDEEESNENNFKVPNSLRYKTTGDKSAAAHKDVIEDATHLITQHRLTELTTQVSALAAQAKSQAKKSNGDNNPAKTQIEVTRLLDQISSHVDAQGNDNLIILADSMHRVVDVIAQSDKPADRLWDILVLSGHAMSAILADRERASDLVISTLDSAMAAIGRQNA